MASSTGEVPSSAFAIGANHFEFGNKVGASRRAIDGARWSVNRHWQDFYLHIQPAANIKFRFKVPRGHYSLSISAGGAGKLSFLGREMKLSTDERRPRLMSLGDINISTGVFQARAEAEPEGAGMVIRYLSFDPHREGNLSSRSPEYEKRLRTLGYVD